MKQWRCRVESLTPATLGLPAFLILTGFVAFYTGLMKGLWYLGREYKALEAENQRLRAERDALRLRLDRGVTMAAEAVSLAERVLPSSGSTG